MPFKLHAPNTTQNRSKVYRVRGTHRGFHIDRTTQTASRTKAAEWLKKWRDQVDRGELSDKPRLTFEAAALAYVQAGRDGRFIEKISDYFGPKITVDEIDQAAIDAAAQALYLGASPATRNRQVHTPIAAILHHNGITLPLRRPKGSQGQRRTIWLTPEAFEAVAECADVCDAELGILMVLLAYTGMRLGEALGIGCEDVDLSSATVFLHKTKNDDPRMVHLPPRAVAALAGHPKGLDRDKRLFRFTRNGQLNKYARLAYAMAGVSCGTAPFHVLRHTWATWMTRQGADLVSTGAWKSQASARVYQHFVAHDEARKADRLPGAMRVA